MRRLARMVSCSIVLGVAAQTFAGPLATDPNAIPAFRGTMSFTDGVLNVNVDYAVFAPGRYALSGGTDPSGGTRFVYAYQGFNISTTRPYSAISVGLATATLGSNPGNDPAYPSSPGGVVPWYQDIDPGASSFRSFFNPPPIGNGKVPPGGLSRVLIFTSNFPPQMFSSSVIDDGQQVQRTLPSPIPEPATVALLILASAFIKRRISR